MRTPILTLALLAGCTSAGVAAPDGTLETYMRAVEAQDPSAAYALLDAATRARVSQERFAELMADNQEELSAQTQELERLLTEGVDAEARVPLGNGETVILVLEDGRWAVDGGVLGAPTLRRPIDAVLSLRAALSRRSLSGVMRVLAREPRAELEADVAQFLDDTTDELDMSVEVDGNTATVRTTGGRLIRLVREAGEWHVLEFR